MSRERSGQDGGSLRGFARMEPNKQRELARTCVRTFHILRFMVRQRPCHLQVIPLRYCQAAETDHG